MVHRLEHRVHPFSTDRTAAIAAAFGVNRVLRKGYETVLADEITHANDALIAGRHFDASVQQTRTMLLVAFGVAVTLAVILALVVTRMILEPLRKVSTVLDAVADGDLTHNVDVEQRDEVGRMAQSLQRATTTLRQMVGDLTAHSASLGGAATALAGTSQQSTVSAEDGARQAASVADSAAISRGSRADQRRDGQAGRLVSVDRQRHQGHHYHRSADQPARAERHHRGRPSR